MLVVVLVFRPRTVLSLIFHSAVDGHLGWFQMLGHVDCGRYRPPCPCLLGPPCWLGLASSFLWLYVTQRFLPICDHRRETDEDPEFGDLKLWISLSWIGSYSWQIPVSKGWKPSSSLKCQTQPAVILNALQILLNGKNQSEEHFYFQLIAPKCESLCFVTNKNICQYSKLGNFAFC